MVVLVDASQGRKVASRPTTRIVQPARKTKIEINYSAHLSSDERLIRHVPLRLSTVISLKESIVS